MQTVIPMNHCSRYTAAFPYMYRFEATKEALSLCDNASLVTSNLYILGESGWISRAVVHRYNYLHS